MTECPIPPNIDPSLTYDDAPAGASIVEELKDEEYGSRGYMAEDVEGHVWYFGTYLPGTYWGDGSA